MSTDLHGRRSWPPAVAWTLWVLNMAALATVPLLDRAITSAGRPDLRQFTSGVAGPVVAMITGATVGAVLVSRRPRHPVGWLFIGLALSLTVTAVIAQYVTWALVIDPHTLPAAGYVARGYPAAALSALICIGFVLLLTPTGSLPSPRWRWWARAMAAVPAGLALVATFAPGRLDPRYQAVGGPFEFRGLGGPLLVANELAFAVASLGVVVAAASLVTRYRHAGGLERLQLRWLAFAAALVVLASGVALIAVVTGVRAHLPAAATLLTWTVGISIAVLPITTGAAILQYRLYDLDRIVSRTVAYALLTLLLGGGYVGIVLLLGQLFGGISGHAPSWAIAAATLAAAAAFQPARRRIQLAVDRRFNRRRHDAATTIADFSLRLRHEVDLDALTGDLLSTVAETMEPSRAALWLRPASALPASVGRGG